MMNLAGFKFKVGIVQNGYFVVFAEYLIELKRFRVVFGKGEIVNLNLLRLSRWFSVRFQCDGSVI